MLNARGIFILAHLTTSLHTKLSKQKTLLDVPVGKRRCNQKIAFTI